MRLTVVAALAVSLAAGGASAQTTIETTGGGQSYGGESFTGASPRIGSIQLKLGSYRPRLDDDPSLEGGTPFADFFGDGGLLLAELEGQRFFYQGIGTAGLSLSAAYGEKYAEGFNQATGGTNVGEKTGLLVFPLSFGAFYRFDYAAFRWGIPVVPYGEVSFRYVPYLFTGTEQGINGGKSGYGLTAGVQLLLDFLEPGLARNLDSDTGVNHTYLFAEYTRAEVNNFGQQGFDFSSRGWMFGLALDY